MDTLDRVELNRFSKKYSKRIRAKHSKSKHKSSQVENRLSHCGNC